MVGGSNSKKTVQSAKPAQSTNPKNAPGTPAAPTAQDLTFQREVEEELRQDKLKKLWADYGTYAIAALVAFIAGIGVYQQYKQWQLAAAQAAGAQYESATRLVTQGKPAEANAALATIAAQGPRGYATLARLQIAAANVAADKPAEAVSSYEAVAASSDVDPVLRDFARLQAAALRLDAADWTEMQNRLNPLTDERNAFRVTAREYLGLTAQKTGHTEDARKLFLQVLGDAKASKSAKERVGGYLSSITAANLAKAPPKPASPAQPSPAPAESAPATK